MTGMGNSPLTSLVVGVAMMLLLDEELVSLSALMVLASTQAQL
jgi:hypothetical protein